MKETRLGIGWDPIHRHIDFVTEFDNGKLDGLDKEKCRGSVRRTSPTRTSIRRTSRSITRWPNNTRSPSTTFNLTRGRVPRHLYLIAAQSGEPGSNWYISENPGTKTGQIRLPRADHGESRADQDDLGVSGRRGQPIFPCLDGTPTIIDEIAGAGLSWRYYTPNLGDLWTAPCDIRSSTARTIPI